jgi:hypothetical protein
VELERVRDGKVGYREGEGRSSQPKYEKQTSPPHPLLKLFSRICNVIVHAMKHVLFCERVAFCAHAYLHVKHMRSAPCHATHRKKKKHHSAFSPPLPFKEPRLCFTRLQAPFTFFFFFFHTGPSFTHDCSSQKLLLRLFQQV